jgi:hypothetical protein
MGFLTNEQRRQNDFKEHQFTDIESKAPFE